MENKVTSPVSLKGKRPGILTLFCILGFIGIIPTIAVVILASNKLPDWYTPFLLFNSVIGLTCLIGLFMMKKWAIHAYTTMFLIAQVVLIASGMGTTILGVSVPIIMIISGYAYYERMT